MQGVDDVLSFWFEPKPDTTEAVAKRSKFWFAGDPVVDQEIKARFRPLVDAARAGELGDWAATVRGRLALTILLDQFTRNVFRGSPEAFAKDPLALEIVRSGWDAGLFDACDALERVFLALPFLHAEDLEVQKRGVALEIGLVAGCPEHYKSFLISAVNSARRHLDVIARFGRFPHRNAVLGRASTAEELAYLVYLKDAGQWL